MAFINQPIHRWHTDCWWCINFISNSPVQWPTEWQYSYRSQSKKVTIHAQLIAMATIYFFNLGAGAIWVATPNILFLKVLKIFFIHFDMINKCPLQYISIKLLLMAPLYVWKVEIFQCGLYLSAGTVRAGTVY